MKHKLILAVVAAVAIYLIFFYREADGVNEVKADLVIHNTTIYTANDDQVDGGSDRR